MEQHVENVLWLKEELYHLTGGPRYALEVIAVYFANILCRYAETDAACRRLRQYLEAELFKAKIGHESVLKRTHAASGKTPKTSGKAQQHSLKEEPLKPLPSLPRNTTPCPHRS